MTNNPISDDNKFVGRLLMFETVMQDYGFQRGVIIYGTTETVNLVRDLAAELKRHRTPVDGGEVECILAKLGVYRHEKEAAAIIRRLSARVAELEAERDEWHGRDEPTPLNRLIWVTDGGQHVWLLNGTGKVFDGRSTACKFWCVAQFPALPNGAPAETIENYEMEGALTSPPSGGA